MLSRNMIPAAVALLVGAVVAGCTPAGQNGPPSPAFSTIPSTIPAPAPLHDDPTASMSVADMSAALAERGVQWSARDVLVMGRGTIETYTEWSKMCAATGSFTDGCGARDIRRSTLPSRCITEAERSDTAPDFGACGLALLYVEKVIGK